MSNFYDQVLLELLAAVGGALFVANLLALVRRRTDARAASARTVARSRPGSPVKGNKRAARDHPADLAQAPVLRSVLYLVIGFLVAVWAIASLTR